MNVQIPIAGVTLSDDQTYDGQIPVWSTRPMMLRLLPDLNKPVNIIVREGGTLIKRITLPYQEIINFDLSFAAPLLRRADRNNSDGTPMFPQQMIEIWGANTMARIIIPVFHCDLTYWDTLGVDSALPQPPKPRIPNQTLDIYFPYRINPSDALFLEVEPVAGAPSNVIFPATYVLGDTIDITYIKKLTIKNVWGNGLDQVINYEDRLMSEAVYDESLQCALRARWNMRNGQWFWAAFKDYFWSNKFTPIRGRGGVTEQAEITINLEYGEEYYNVYQELLVSSNVVFDLNIPGINQYQSKRFRAEVMGDTGARWSNSTKTYRQQVRFKTTELQDNYMFPLAPDQPPAPSIVFTAQKNPWSVPPQYNPNISLQMYSNAAYYTESEPSWFAVTYGTTLLTPDMFEQGDIYYDRPGESWEAVKRPANSRIRLKTPFTDINAAHSLISGVPGFLVIVANLDANGLMISNSNWTTINGRVNAQSPQLALVIAKAEGTITPADITTLNAYWGKRYEVIPAGTQYVTGVLLSNPGDARTGTLSFRSMAGAVSYPVTINQEKASISLSPSEVQLPRWSQNSKILTIVTSNTPWRIDPDPQTWIFPTFVTEGGPGTDNMFFNISGNTGAQRTAYITFRSKLNSSVYKTLTVTQAAASGTITVNTPTIAAGYIHLPVTVAVTAFGTWHFSQQDSWITPSQYDGPGGTTTVTLTIGDNLPAGASARTGTITFYNNLTTETKVVTVNQAGAPTSIKILPIRISGPKAGGNQIVSVVATSDNGWTMGSAPSWVSVTPTSGGAGQTAIAVKYDTPNNTGAKRSGYLRLENTTTHEIAICIIEQLG